MGLGKWIRRAIGEQSALRQPEDRVIRLRQQYTLDSTTVNYELARRLYRNTQDEYKLGAWAAKPVVNTMAGFMGAPHFMHPEDEAQNALDEFFGQQTGRLLRINRNCVRDGDVYARLELRMDQIDREPKISMRLIPPEWCSPLRDPLSGELREFVIKWPVINYERQTSGELRQMGRYVIRETLRPNERELSIEEGNAPADTLEALRIREEQEREDNAWGFIPIVHFKNEAEENQMFGSSDLEPIEPLMRAYHDTMLYAVEGAKMFARPKAKMKLADVKKFLENNFTEEEIAKGRLPFHNKEIFFMGDGDDAEFITADSGLQGTTLLLEFIFYCMVDVSQTPEFAFGTAVASSKASVSEQMPVLARNIRRKRGEYADPYRELGAMYLSVAAQTLTIKVPESKSYATEIDWEEITPRDDASVADTMNTLVTGLVTAVEGGLMSLEAATEFLSEFVPSMLPFVTEGADEDERTRILRTKQFLQRLEGGDFDNVPKPDSRPELEVVEGEG